MRLSVVFELLLVFLFLAFAAARVIGIENQTKNAIKGQKKTTVLRQGPPNRYCACTSRMCNCCRDFSLPVVPIKGPGCASIMYVQRDTMMVTMSFGDRVLSNTTITGRTPKPVCMALPGGISQFCGRIYGISRKGDQFRACLGLELRALDDIEAALRVSCFKFGPKGVKLESAPPVPAETSGKDPEEDEDDDDYDLDDDDDDDDEGDFIGFDDDDDEGSSNEDNEVGSDPVDYTGFSVLGEDLLGTFFSDDSDAENNKKKVTKKTAKPQLLLTKQSTTTRRPVLLNLKRSTVKPDKVTLRPLNNKVIKKPKPKPQIGQNFQQTVSSGVSSLSSFQTSPSGDVTLPTINPDKKTPLKKPIIPVSTTVIPSVTYFEKETQKIKTERIPTLSTDGVKQTEESMTFTTPTKKVEIIKNDIKIPQMDLEKLEAVAAIAQQDVTSGVISSSSASSPDSSKPMEAITIRYENVTPENIYTFTKEKINSVKFEPENVITSKPDFQIHSEDSLSNEALITKLTGNAGITSIKNRVTAYYQGTETTISDNEDKEEENDTERETENEKYEISQNNNLSFHGITSENFDIINVKKQKIKPHQDQSKDEEKLSDGDDSQNVNGETKFKEVLTVYTNNIKKPIHEMSNSGEEFIETYQKAKPPKTELTEIKPLPSKSDSEGEDDDEDENDELLDSLEVDDLNEGEEYEEKENESTIHKEREKVSTQKETIKINNPIVQINKAVTTKQPAFQISHKVPTHQNDTNVKIKIPIMQTVTTESSTLSQTFIMRKPEIATDKIFNEKTPEEKIVENVTEKIIIHKQPLQKVTEKLILYQHTETPEKVFVHTHPINTTVEEPTKHFVLYEKPIKSVAEKIIIFKEPAAPNMVESVLPAKDSKVSSDEDIESDEEVENDEESEEESDDDSDSEKSTLFASIIKDEPDFSNKYAEEHDLSDGDDLDIDDPDEEITDYEEDRKFKEKKSAGKSQVNSKISAVPIISSFSDPVARPKSHYEGIKNNRPISSSRTHRRMNLDKLWPK